MRIGEVAEQLGIASSRIRYYEREGLLGEIPRVSGRRELNASVVSGIEFILLAQAAGFSIEDIRLLVTESNRETDPRDMWRTVAAAKRKKIEDDIAKLQTMDRILAALLECECLTRTECVQRYSLHRQSSVAKIDL